MESVRPDLPRIVSRQRIHGATIRSVKALRLWHRACGAYGTVSLV
jgi:hypothetical protein